MREAIDVALNSDPRVLNNRTGELQLVLAVKGGADVHQCQKCNKYFSSKKSCLKHLRNLK